MAVSKPEKLRSIFHDPEYYVKSFQAYSDLSSRLSILTTWIETVFPIEVVDKLPAVTPGSDGSERPLRILGVGSGAGKTDCDMITRLLVRFPRISNVALEPAHDHVDQYKRLVTSLALTGVEWDWREQTWEEYWETTEGNRQTFPFISAVHSVYYFADVEKSILNMYELLEKGGSMLIIVLSDDSGYGRLWRRFPMFEDDLEKHVLTDTLRNIFNRNKIKYDVVRQPSQVDISICFEKGNEQGILVTDFLAHVIDLEHSVSPKVLEDFYEYLRGPECSIIKDGKVLFNNSWDAVIVRK